MRAFIGLDIGTSAVKGALTSEDGRVLSVASNPFSYIVEKDARFLDPEAFCDVCFSVIKKLAEFSDHEIAGVCSCHASGNLLLLDGNGKPVTPIVGWQTLVPKEDIDRVFTEKEQKAVYAVAGWPLGRRMALSYLAWIKIHRPDLLEKTAIVTMSAEYLNYRLTGKWGISPSMGTPSLIMDQERGTYNLTLLEKLGIADKFFPPIFEKGTVLGSVLPDIANKLGLSEKTKIVLGSFDHPSGALGAGVMNEGELLLSCGTSWVELFPVNSRSFALSTGGLVDRFSLYGAPYCVMKSLTSVTEKIDEYRERFFGKIPHKEFDGYIAESSLGCSGLSFDLGGNDLSKAESFSKPDIARAILEGAAVMLKNNLVSLRECGLRADRITAIGGVTNSPVCVRVLEEVLGQKISVINGQSAGAVGSCLLAGVGLGIYRDEKEAFGTMYDLIKG